MHTTPDLLAGRDIDSKGAFNVVVLYEDFFCGKRAMEICSRLIGELGKKFVFDLSLWKFSVVTMPEFSENASREAVEADLIIIAAHDEGELPFDLSVWMDSWLPLKRTQRSAMVALLDRGGEDGPAQPSAIHSFLEKSAVNAGMDFFSQTVDVAPTAGELSCDIELGRLAKG